ncbi:sensor domain-containing diguanylate cyclase [Pseudomonas asplenii]|uniref:sensor domain-containing diguanylate cyclase n=1 Tax=Pseudomonas asplenii TaxID=53407 RepID=UPI00235E3F02|nr:sensor domain-containing diguanylate cyclase [Pseudomonas asplenii]
MKRDIQLVVVLLSVIGCSLASLAFWKLIASREQALDEINVHGLNLAQALSTYSEGIVRQSSLLLLGLVERLETEGIDSAQIERLNTLVSRQLPLMPQMSGITIYDRQGRWMVSSSQPIPTGLNSSDRAFFIHHRDDPSREPFIGPPIRCRLKQEWVITISRRFNDRKGDFAGVVAVTLGIENFLRLFGAIDVGRDGAIGLSYTDGSILVRYPFREEDMARSFSNSPIREKYLADRNVGNASFTSSLDGVDRLYAFRKSETLPLVTTVALGKDEALAAWRLEAMLSFMVVAGLLMLTGFIGVLLICDIRRRNHVEEELRVVQSQLLEKNHQLARMAMDDALTGLANRRCFDERLLVEVNRAQRDRTPLALLMIDIDYFKLYNDRYGHPAGDACLQTVSAVLSTCIRRPCDLLARYGGEELVVILPNTEIEGASVVAQLMIERLNQHNIPHESSPDGHITISMGVTELRQAVADPLQSLLNAADEALYSAKEAGRNRLAVC